MPLYDCIRTVQVDQTSRRELPAAKFKVGDSVEIYYGPYEGHRFTIKAVRYNLDANTFEYYRDSVLMDGWFRDGQVVA